MVTTGKIITAAGVSVGIDMALTLAARLRGERAAQLRLRADKTEPFALLRRQQRYFVGQQGCWELSYESRALLQRRRAARHGQR